MAKVELKQPVVDEISANIKDAQSVVLVDYRGLTVEQDTNLRKQLRESIMKRVIEKVAVTPNPRFFPLPFLSLFNCKFRFFTFRFIATAYHILTLMPNMLYRTLKSSRRLIIS